MTKITKSGLTKFYVHYDSVILQELQPGHDNSLISAFYSNNVLKVYRYFIEILMGH